METDIKCVECGKMTRHFELGRVFYNPDHLAKSVIIQDPVICPKCKKDISNEKFLIKENYFFMAVITANLCASVKDVPSHLRNVFPVFHDKDYAIIKERCKSRPKFVIKF